MTRTVLALLLGAATVVGGCEQMKRSPTAGRVDSLAVTLREPALDHLGSPMAPVTAQSATFDVEARDEQGQLVAADLSLNIFISFGGVKTGVDSSCGADTLHPLETVQLKGGALRGHTIALSGAYGPTAVWVEDPSSNVAGASAVIYFRNPYIDELQQPADITAPNATYCSPFNGKFVTIDHARPGGQLVVTSVYGNAFSITDTGGTSGFNSIYLYAFGKPPLYIVEGRPLRSVSGNYSKFLGFTELNFPLFDGDENSALVSTPAPIAIAASDVNNVGTMLKAAAGVVKYSGTICDLSNDSWVKFNEITLGNNGSCDAFSNAQLQLPAKVMGDFDPTKHVNQRVTVTGMLQNRSGANPYLDTNGNTLSCSDASPCQRGNCINGTCYKSPYNFWTVLPRTPADIVVGP